MACAMSVSVLSITSMLAAVLFSGHTSFFQQIKNRRLLFHDNLFKQFDPGQDWQKVLLWIQTV